MGRLNEPTDLITRNSSTMTTKGKNSVIYFAETDYAKAQSPWELPQKISFVDNKLKKSSMRQLGAKTQHHSLFSSQIIHNKPATNLQSIFQQDESTQSHEIDCSSKKKKRVSLSAKRAPKMQRESSIKKSAKASMPSFMIKSQSQMMPPFNPIVTNKLGIKQMTRQQKKRSVLGATQIGRAAAKKLDYEDLIMQLEPPFNMKDLAMPQTRKVSKILREGKSVPSTEKELPMLA